MSTTKCPRAGLVIRFAVLLALLAAAAPARLAHTAGTTYYVSTSGNDDNDGLSAGTPFATVAQVNALDLLPGDQVLFKCGDTWRADMLVISRSGSDGSPITFGSYPAGCTNRPILSGAQPIAGWTSSGTANVYVADLAAGANSGKFAYGVNQLFRGSVRLPLGRWPNLDTGNGGYATIDAQPAGDEITDGQLPAGIGAGAVAHIRGMTWYILNRQVTGRSGQTLKLGANAGCWGNCTGWGYFLNNHLATLDQEGEWYYDAAAQRVYLYSAGSAPADEEIEGSVILKNDDHSWGGVLLGVDLNEPGVSYIVVENLNVRRWFRHGIATPTNHAHAENHHLTLRNNVIADVDGLGINLMAWVWSATDGRPDGWRGGYNLTLDGNLIDTANSMGINTYGRDSTFSNNVIRNVGLIQNLGAAGLGCGFTAGEGACTEDGDGLRIKIDELDDSGNSNTVTGNRLERIAYNGIDVFGHHNSFERNVIQDACYSKADCGGVRTFGRDNLSSTPVHDLSFQQNLIVNAFGNMDGCKEGTGVQAFGFYIDSYSRDVALSGNTVISSTVHGILFQNSTGSITGNTLYNNARTWDYAAQVYVGSSPAYVGEHTDNVLYGLRQAARTLSISDLGRLGASDRNAFFNPYWASHIYAGGDDTLAAWQTYSGKDAHSIQAWFSQAAAELPRSRIFYNDTAQVRVIPLGTSLYLDLDQNEVKDSLTLQPYTSRVLIYNGENLTPDLGPSIKIARPLAVAQGMRVNYTVVIRNQGGPITATVRMTDSLPLGLSYVPGTLASTMGAVDASLAPVLRWSGVLSRTPAVTVTYAVTVTATLTQAIANTALIAAPPYPTVARTASVGVNWRPVYLPLVRRQSS
jgi:uncharacterized repeat protein (TIGR01451 family)